MVARRCIAKYSTSMCKNFIIFKKSKLMHIQACIFCIVNSKYRLNYYGIYGRQTFRMFKYRS